MYVILSRRSDISSWLSRENIILGVIIYHLIFKIQSMNIHIIAFLTVFSSIILSWTYAISLFLIRLFPLLDSYSPLLIATSISLSVLFIVGIVGANSYPHAYFTLVYRIWAYWLWGLTIGGLVAVIFLIFAIFSGQFLTHEVYLILWILLTLALNIYAVSQSFIPVVQSYRVDITTPHHWHGKRIIMIADTHYGNIYGIEHARKLVDLINTLKGEVVIIPWDFFDGPLIDYQSIAREFDRITTPHGVIFSNGNHEEYQHTYEIQRALQASKITILNNRKITLDGMNFIGVSYHTSETRAWLEATLKTLELKTWEPTILLKHKPTLHATLLKYPIDLVVSGHAHRGQMWPFSLIPALIFGKYSYGMTRDRSMTSITTSGVGTWWPPQRLGTESEVVVIEVE